MKLFPHQEDGASFLAGEGGTVGLFFGMGTGKTITALEAFQRSDANQLLVIAPPIAMPMWKAEAERYTGRVANILRTGKWPLESQAVQIVSYNIAAKRADELREWCDKDCTALVCDESHALKNPKAKRTKSVLGSKGIADGAHYTWLLTGTPITRWNDDMYPFLCRADMDGMKARLGGSSLDKFQLRYTIRQKRQFPGARFPVQMVVGNRNTEELADWVYGDDLALRVDLEEVFKDMPPITFNRYPIELDKKTMGKEALDRLKELEKKSISDIHKAAQVNEPALATVRRELGLGMVKGAVAEIMERVESGQNVLVGAWHTEVIDALSAEFTTRNYQNRIIDGRTPTAQKSVAEHQWNNGDVQVLICQIAAAGVSLNLQQGGSQIIVVEEDWSPSIMDQFYARLWRYGQEKHVHVDTLTTDTKLSQALGRISKTKAGEHERFNRIGREQ